MYNSTQIARNRTRRLPALTDGILYAIKAFDCWQIMLSAKIGPLLNRLLTLSIPDDTLYPYLQNARHHNAKLFCVIFVLCTSCFLDVHTHTHHQFPRCPNGYHIVFVVCLCVPFNTSNVVRAACPDIRIYAEGTRRDSGST